jgi:hypothetical protein
VDRTAERRRLGAPTAPIRILPAEPGQRPRGLPLRSLLFRYLAVGFVLLATVAIASPHRPDRLAGPAPQPWDYQRDQVSVDGGGALNAYARTAIGATAWLTKASIERQRDVYRLNLFSFLVGERGARGLAGWRAEHRPLLENGTKLALVALVAYGVVLRPSRRIWALAVLLLVAATLLVTKPIATARVAASTSTAVPNGMLEVVARVAPGGGIDGPGGAEPAQRRLATRYWTSFVANPLSRMQTGSSVLETAPPGRKAGVLDNLRRNVSAVNDWAIGRHGPERAFIATAAAGYVLPFAVALGVLAMVAACAQTVLFLLGMASLFALPFAALGPRERRGLIRYLLFPAAGSLVVLAVASLLSFVVMRTADAIHATDEYVGVLLAGSTWPVVAAALLWRRFGRRRWGPARQHQERPA